MFVADPWLGGFYAVMTGNAEGTGAEALQGNSLSPLPEPARNPGPAVLTRSELVEPFLALGLELLEINSTRFDRTPAYVSAGYSETPLAWLAVFQKPA